MAIFSTHLTPDTQRLAAWLVTEALAWFQSGSPEVATATVGLACFVVVASLFLMAEQVLTWAVRQ